jgi:hypothetical protein
MAAPRNSEQDATERRSGREGEGGGALTPGPMSLENVPRESTRGSSGLSWYTRGTTGGARAASPPPCAPI